MTAMETGTADIPLPIASRWEPAVLDLNNRHATELSWLERGRLSALIARAFLARRIGGVDAFLIAFDQDADYDSPNFRWFRSRHDKFVYVDRVVVDPACRGRGHARRLYLDLFDNAARHGHALVTCEVNADPPNPASDAFHASMGFHAVGEARLGDAKAVRYFVRPIGTG